jgi:hypothetical protein
MFAGFAATGEGKKYFPQALLEARIAGLKGFFA